MPVAVMVPKVALPPTTSFTSHCTVLGDMGTYAVNCWTAPCSIEEFAGYTVIVTAWAAAANIRNELNIVSSQLDRALNRRRSGTGRFAEGGTRLCAFIEVDAKTNAVISQL